MPELDDNHRDSGFDSTDHQPCYIYSPTRFANENVATHTTTRPAKKRKVGNLSDLTSVSRSTNFELSALLNGSENIECRRLRRELFCQAWDITKARIQDILDSSNQSTVDGVSNFIISTVVQNKEKENNHKIFTGFITTGPNISSQELIFKQISCRLKSDTSGPVVVIRSVDAPSLKSVLKQLIREAIIQWLGAEYDENSCEFENGRKLLSYDLKILHNFVKKHDISAITIAFQDSEAFDTTLVSEMINLISSWMDRIPFTLIFGIATTVDLFKERISTVASRRLSGFQFETEDTDVLLQRIFLRAVAGANVPLRLSPDLISALMERQKNHLKSIEAFIAGIKYAYMCHYYLDALSVFNITKNIKFPSSIVQPEHLEAVRMLSSFRGLIESQCKPGSSREQLFRAQSLLTDDKILLDKIERSISSKDVAVTRLLQAIHVLVKASPESPSVIDLYLTAFTSCLGESEFVLDILDSIKRMSPMNLLNLVNTIIKSIQSGAPNMNLDGWAEEEKELISELSKIKFCISKLEKSCSQKGKALKSSYAIHSKGIRTTVVAQRVQLSYEESTLSDEDKEFTALVDQFSQLLADYFSAGHPQNNFLSEVWTFDSLQQHCEVFTPRPRAAIERALSKSSDYLNHSSANFLKETGTRLPSTSILYQMYLESGSLINIFDLWKAFAAVMRADNEVAVDERDMLVHFYRALADLKMLGMIKQSKRKADHLTKLLWKGL